MRGQSCPTNFGSSVEDVRCSGRDRGGHDSGSSIVPSSTPGPQADRGSTAGRRRHHGTLCKMDLQCSVTVVKNGGRRAS